MADPVHIWCEMETMILHIKGKKKNPYGTVWQSNLSETTVRQMAEDHPRT